MRELNDEQLAAVERRLDERAQFLASAVSMHVARLRDLGAPGYGAVAGDSADHADIEQERDQENGAMERDVRELSEIESARERIAADEVGVCVDCGEPIGFDRLLVQPTALRCVPCQSENERVEPLKVGAEGHVPGERR